MLQVSDVRETRVFQEAMEEGVAQGRNATLESVVFNLHELGRPVSEIAKATDLTVARVRAILKQKSSRK